MNCLTNQLLVLILCAILVKQSSSRGLTVLGPKMIRPHSTYSVAIVNSFNHKIRLEMRLESLTNASFRQAVTFDVPKETIHVKPIQVQDLYEDEYSLEVTSLSSQVPYSESIELDYLKKTMSVFIQTDKPVYKPGDLLRIRVIVIDKDTRPISTLKTISVGLFDSDDNSIRQWPFATLYRGVFQTTVQLGSSPVLGTWSLKATTPEETVTQEIELREYVLPTFEVKVTTPRILLISERKVIVDVEALYTFGLSVEGTARVDLYLNTESKKPSHTKKLSINGIASVEFNYREPVDADEKDFAEIIVVATVTESHTNKIMNVTQPIKLYQYPYRMSIVALPMFRPGSSFKMQLLVKDHLGNAATGQKDVELTAHYQGEVSEPENTISRPLNSQGVLSVTLYPPKEATKMNVSVICDGIDYGHIKEIDGVISQSKKYLTVTLKRGSSILPGKNIGFDVVCSEAMTHYFYIVVSRGAILAYNTKRVSRRIKDELRIKLTSEMAPTMRLIVLYIKDGYLIYDEKTLEFQHLNNDFQLTLDTAETLSDTAIYSPNDPIKIDVKAAEDSFVAFQAIDKSALLLGRPWNQVKREDILKELSIYSGTDEENQFDHFSVMGLFLRSTAMLDSVAASSRLGTRFSFGSSKPTTQSIQIRTQFPETWMWTNISMGGRSNNYELRATVPDTITSWYVAGFALSPTMGLGVIREPKVLLVKQPFYIVANLPYSIKRGEVTVIQVTVFNFLPDSVATQVTLYNRHEGLEFMDSSTARDDTRSKAIVARAGTGTPVSFLIKAKKLGDIAIKVVAHSDAVEHILRVTPESHKYEGNIARYIDLPRHGKLSFRKLVLRIPDGVDEDSVKIVASVNGNILGKAIQNLDNLIRKPTGCGEQNMLHFVPNIVILDYLTEADILEDEVRSKAINFLQSGYQNQLKYKRPDGAFNLWGKTDTSGCTFLTAFVAKSFKIAAKYINIDDSVVLGAFKWLASVQKPSGKFEEVGTVFHAEIQGGLRDTNYALTAYVLIAFLESSEIAESYSSTVNNSVKYLVDNFRAMDDVYDLALSTYALSLNNHPQKTAFINKLLEKSILDEANTYRYWNRHPVSVEVAGYALLSYLTQNRIVDATPIMRWLNTQRYAQGAYSGTQDTFVGLKALAMFAAKTSISRNNYRVHINYNKFGGKAKFDIDRTQSLTTNEMALPSDSRNVDVEIEGIGVGILQIAWQYYKSIQTAKHSFKLDVKLLPTTTYHVQYLRVCVSYEPKESYQFSNMAYVEVFLPSGMVVDEQAVNELSGNEIKKVELREAGTSLVVYYDKLGTDTKCFVVTSYRRFSVALHRPAYVVIYDYYDNDRFAIQAYEGKTMDVCDICTDEDCRHCRTG